MKEKKPFKETKLGQFLSTKAPQVLDAVGNLLPDQGLIGIVKRIISQNNIGLTPEDQREGLKLVQAFEKEMFGLEVQDRDSARKRESEYVKATGHIDYMQMIVGFIGLSIFGFMVWVVVYEDVHEENREMLIHTIGIIEGVVLSIFAYYFGSSKGSAEKNKLLNR
jgi:hypothetical protein